MLRVSANVLLASVIAANALGQDTTASEFIVPQLPERVDEQTAQGALATFTGLVNQWNYREMGFDSVSNPICYAWYAH